MIQEQDWLFQNNTSTMIMQVSKSHLGGEPNGVCVTVCVHACVPVSQQKTILA